MIDPVNQLRKLGHRELGDLLQAVQLSMVGGSRQSDSRAVPLTTSSFQGSNPSVGEQNKGSL